MDQQKHPKKKSFKTYARFSGIVFQMIAIIVAGSYIGVRLDENFPNENNWYTISLSLISVIISVIVVIKNINSASKDTSKNE